MIEGYNYPHKVFVIGPSGELVKTEVVSAPPKTTDEELERIVREIWEYNGAIIENYYFEAESSN